jgi:hypothetical protein
VVGMPPPLFFRQFHLRLVLVHNLIGDIFGAVLITVLASSLFGTVANLTTGVTIAHSKFNNATITFTPNINITSSIGFVPIIQLVPFVFGAMVLVMVYAIFQRHIPGGF